MLMRARRIGMTAAACLALTGAAACRSLDEDKAASREKVSIALSPSADRLERLAAEELRSYLKKLFDLDAPIEAAGNGLVIRVGTVAEGLSDQGILLRRSGRTLTVAGGSPRATLWAVYELVERWGVRYLHYRDVLPEPRAWDGLPDLDVSMEPNMRIRCWRLINDLAFGPVSWSLEENRRFLRQIAKMKYNRIHTFLWPVQPFVHYAFRGVQKPPGVLYFGQRHPIDADTIGRGKFGGMKVFTNPEFVGADTPQELHRRAVAHVRAIHREARRLGMRTVVSFEPFRWPKEFRKVIPNAQPARQLGNWTVEPVPRNTGPSPAKFRSCSRGPSLPVQAESADSSAWCV